MSQLTHAKEIGTQKYLRNEVEISRREKNHKSYNINMFMSVGTFNTGIEINKINKLFTSVRLIFPVKKKLCENYQKLKPLIIYLAKIELKKTYRSLLNSKIN